MTQDPIFVWMVQPEKTLYSLEYAKDQNTIGTKKISGEWERGNFLPFLKSHLPHLPCKGVYMRPQLPLHKVNGVNDEKFNKFLLWSFSMVS